jgi:hypothetical protein
MSAKDIVLRPIPARDADALVRRVHYSGKTVNNSQIHIGVFYGGAMEGAMQFGPSLDKRKLVGLVAGTKWNAFIELNRMAFTDALPRNSESRAIGIAMRMLRAHAPHLQWVVSFADATQCGDGTIYRASGFVLTGMKRNNQVWVAPDEAGSRESRTSLTDNRSHRQQAAAQRVISRVTVTKGNDALRGGGAASMKQYIAAGFRPLDGYQLRYVYFLDPSCRERLTVPVIPFAEIARCGAGMYRGAKRAASIGSDAPGDQPGEGGATPTAALHSS